MYLQQRAPRLYSSNPAVYGSSHREWSAVGNVLAAAVFALLAFMVYYFALIENGRADEGQTYSRGFNAPMQTMPIPMPQPILMPFPSADPQVGMPPLNVADADLKKNP